MRRICIVFLIICSLLFVVGCAKDEDDSDDGGDDIVTDDDDTSEPPDYTEPWNEDLPTATVNIVSPAPGAFIDASQVVVQGSVTGSDADQVLINGEAVDVNAGAFQATVAFETGEPVLPIYVATSPEADVFGADKIVVVQGVGLDRAETAADAFFLTLGDDALAVVGALISELLSDLDLMPVIEPLNPIVDSETLTVEITSAAIDGATFNAAFLETGLGFQGALTDVVFGLRATIGALPLEFEMTVGSFNFQGLADLLVEDGAATVSITDFDLSHEDLTVEGILPAGIVELILGVVEGAVEGLISDTLPGALEDILAALEIQTTLIGFDLELALTTIDVGAGALIAGFDLNAYLTDPPLDLPWPGSSRFTDGDPPNFLAGRPQAATDFGFGFSLGDDILNKVMLGVADSGLLELALGAAGTQPDVIELELNAGTLAIIFPALGSVDPETTASLVLTPMAVPVAVPGADGSLALRIPDWRMDVYLHPEGEAAWRAMGLSFDLVFALDADPDEAGKLVVSLPALMFDVRYLYNPVSDASPVLDLLTTWVPDLLGGLINLVLGELPIGLPEIAGVGLEALYWNTDGANSDYWTAYFGMTYTPPEF
ncbi:MAG: hypothetical protein P9L99_08310 [Candidatus Lernaella stagnicola]|nr:hypothetical protein [Candidatus Lernaella stagnicola]